MLQKKYASPAHDAIPLSRRFICCVDLACDKPSPDVYVLPAEVVSKGLHYYFNSNFPNSPSYHLSLDFKPQGSSKKNGIQTVGEFINADRYLENYEALAITPVLA
jgi:hydroxymethylpyrimidine pyrophosphatase-like HAD family hydrolase